MVKLKVGGRIASAVNTVNSGRAATHFVLPVLLPCVRVHSLLLRLRRPLKPS